MNLLKTNRWLQVEKDTWTCICTGYPHGMYSGSKPPDACEDNCWVDALLKQQAALLTFAQLAAETAIDGIDTYHGEFCGGPKCECAARQTAWETELKPHTEAFQ